MYKFLILYNKVFKIHHSNKSIDKFLIYFHFKFELLIMPINKFAITSEYHNISVVSKKIKAFCIKESVPINVIDAVEICLMEALNNVIKHSYKGLTGKKIDLIVSINPKTIDIDIMETGLPRTDIKKPTLEFNPDDLNSAPEGGMGLYIIDSLMNKTAYSSNNGLNITSFSKNLYD